MIDGVIVIFFIWFFKKNKCVTSLQAKDLNRFAYPSNDTHIVINKRKKEYLKKNLLSKNISPCGIRTQDVRITTPTLLLTSRLWRCRFDKRSAISDVLFHLI